LHNQPSSCIVVIKELEDRKGGKMGERGLEEVRGENDLKVRNEE
jgi:hypothetical protein